MSGSIKKNGLFIFIVSISAIGGNIAGNLIGNKFSDLSFLKSTFSIGTSKPLILDFKIISLTFGININFNIIAIICIILAIIFCRRVS
ncbi:MAG: DUF4321 domain-containing protein [Bacillota bacterium]|nr:DUF4321 domain-containing protein [Bacillota bacterium]